MDIVKKTPAKTGCVRFSDLRCLIPAPLAPRLSFAKTCLSTLPTDGSANWGLQAVFVNVGRFPKNRHGRFAEAREAARALADTDGFHETPRKRKKVEMLFAHLKR